MPATIVHSYFAKDLHDILPDEIKNKIDVDRLKMFGQGMDSLMFYNIRTLTKMLVTQATCIRLLSSMDSLMFNQV